MPLGRERRAIGERLLALRHKLGMNQVRMAAALGVSQTFVSSVEIGKSLPSAALMAGVDRLGFRPHWLMTGEGEMRRDTEEPAGAVRDGPLTARQLRILGRVPAGYPGPSPVEERVEGYFPMSYENVPDPEAFCLRVTGDSMVPIIEEGDLVVVSPALRGKVKSGDLVVVQMEGGDTWVKRLSGTRRQAFLVSANPTFPPILLDPEIETTIIGKVVYTIHRYK